MNIFELPQQLSSLTGGAARYDVSQVYPISGNVANAIVGTGTASGISTFQWQDSNLWWSPAMSYFNMWLRIVKYDNTTAGLQGLPPTYPGDYIAYADNFIDTLFTQIKSQINSRQLDIIDNPWLISSALEYTNCRQNFIKTFGSLTRLGEPFMNRLANTTTQVAQAGAPGGVPANGIALEVIFRPPLSLFDCKVLPPGAQFRVDFNWAPSAANAFESPLINVPVGTGLGNYNIIVDSFSFYKATVMPNPMLELPAGGVIELEPTTVNQYQTSDSQSLTQQITLPSTCNRISLMFQDQGSGTYTSPSTATAPVTPTLNTITAGVRSGPNPVVNCALLFSPQAGLSAADPYNVGIDQLWLTLPELGQQLPTPVYAPGLNTQDYYRMYMDFCQITQGTSEGIEGNIPFGNLSISPGVPITASSIVTDAISTSSSVSNIGLPQNPRNAVIHKLITGVANATNTINISSTFGATTLTLTPTATTFNQFAKYGWAGEKPIIVFPVIRPENKTVSIATLNVKFEAAVKNVQCSVLTTFSMVLQLTHMGNGQYNYEIVTGV